MKKVVIFGNSGSGKSTLAMELQENEGLAHLDLDTVAWQPGLPPRRKALAESRRVIDSFTASNAQWVIEGCYADLLEMVIAGSSEIIYLNLPTAACMENARRRPWEPHKYASREEQDANLPMLLDWIAEYDQRDDTFSRTAHESLFSNYPGKKTMYTDNTR